MLKAVIDNEGFPENRISDAFAARIQAYYHVYGTGRSFASFWYQLKDGVVVALVCRVDGVMTLSCSDGADYDELSEFITAVGALSLICEERVCAAMGLVPADSSFIVEYRGGAQERYAALSGHSDMKQLFELLSACGFSMGDYSSFLADYCARLNKGAAKLLCVSEGNCLVASASALFIGERSVLLGAVATDARYRGRGYASALVSELSRGYYPSKKVFLLCKNDSLAHFYENIGFCPTGRWAAVNI